MPAIKDSTKRRLRKFFRRSRKDAAELGQQADEQIEKLLIRRFDRLISVRRFVFLWIVLFSLLLFSGVLQLRALAPYYQTLKPVAGGLYNEGLIGTFTNANPIYSTGTADVAVSRLIFSGLFKYDEKNNLVGDLAEKWELDPTEKIYTVHLKNDVSWHDDKPFTADDVVFTYHSIQNIEAQSPFYTSWRGINVTKKNTYAVSFELPNSLSAFPHSLTTGIIPEHILGDRQPSQLRSASFNTSPVGTGPFKWKFVEVTGSTSVDRQQHISLAAYDDYHAGRPQLDGFSVITFSDEQRLVEAFKKKQLNAMSGLDFLPDEFHQDKAVHIDATPITGVVMAFFNNSRSPLDNVNIRQALVSGVDRRPIPGLLQVPPRLANSPLLRGQLGYNLSLVQVPYDAAKANQLLEQEGWKRGENGQRTKEGKTLALNLRSENSQEYTEISRYLQKQWGKLGIKVTVHNHEGEDLQRTFIAEHDYDILLYGISLGVDPDVFVYWSSSQAGAGSSGRLNLSEYKSKAADSALEGARTRSDPALRVVKYKSFLSAWRQDAPALALYQPNFIYVTNGPVFGSDRQALNSGADRFYNVHEWMVRQQRQAED